MDVLDPWRAAKMLLDQMGERAPEHATRRISELTSEGDRAGAEVWGEILAAMAVLRRQGPEDGERLH